MRVPSIAIARFGPTVGMVVLAFSAAAQAQVLFEDDLGAASAADWFELASFDTVATFGYDYSTDGIPPAPHGDDTIGLKTEVNTFEGLVNELALVHEDSAFSGQFTVQVDIWNNWFPNPGNVGTTEFTGAGVGHDGFSIGPSGGLLLFDGDGDTARDYRFYKDYNEQFIESGQYAIDANNNSNPVLQEAFPGFDINDAVPDQGLSGAVPDGAAGFQWMTMTIEVDTEAIGDGVTQDPGVATFKLTSAQSGNTVTIGAIDNSNGGDVVNLAGSAGLFMVDVFSSVSLSPDHSFGLFDNVLVTAGIDPNGNGVVGDYSGNGLVEQADLDLVLSNWGGDGDPPPDGWTNNPPTGTIDQEELDQVLVNWGAMAAAGRSAAVPEPATAALAALTALLLTVQCAGARRE